MDIKKMVKEMSEYGFEFVMCDDEDKMNKIYKCYCSKKCNDDKYNRIKKMFDFVKNDDKFVEYMGNDFNKLCDSFVNESMASYLHNSLQSELLALSYQIEESAKDPNTENARRLLEKLGSRINRSISDDFENFVERPLDRLSRIQTGWKGIAAISIEIPDHLLLDANRNFLIVQIIEEAITNAVRFSKSSEVNIVGRETLSGEIYIVIRNNGEAEQQTTTGMGTEWLDRFAAGNWTRTLSDKGTTLEITL